MSANTNPPSHSTEIVEANRRPTKHWWDWADRIGRRILALETTAQAAADAVAGISATHVPSIYPIPGETVVYGSVDTDWHIGIDPAVTAMRAIQGPPGRDGEPGEPSYIPGPKGDKGDTGATGPAGSGGSGGAVIIQQDHYHDDSVFVMQAAAASGGSGQAAIQFKDEGSNIGSSGAITSVDFVGSGISAAVVGTALTLTASGGGSSGAWTHISTTTVAGAAATSITFSGLDIATDGAYLISLDFTAANAAELHLQVNGDTTAGNYASQTWRSLNATYAAGQFNTKLSDLNNAADFHFEIQVTRTQSGVPMVRSLGIEYGSGFGVQDREAVGLRKNTANTTSLTVLSNTANTFPIGATFKLFKRTP